MAYSHLILSDCSFCLQTRFITTAAPWYAEAAILPPLFLFFSLYIFFSFLALSLNYWRQERSSYLQLGFRQIYFSLQIPFSKVSAFRVTKKRACNKWVLGHKRTPLICLESGNFQDEGIKTLSKWSTTSSKFLFFSAWKLLPQIASQ